MISESYYNASLNERGVDLTLHDYWIECVNHRKRVLGFERNIFEDCMSINMDNREIPFPVRLKMSRFTGVRMTG